jgi:hypothetical protein
MIKTGWQPLVAVSGPAIGLAAGMSFNGSAWHDAPIFIAATSFQLVLLLSLWRSRPWKTRQNR